MTTHRNCTRCGHAKAENAKPLCQPRAVTVNNRRNMRSPTFFCGNRFAVPISQRYEEDDDL